MIGDKNQRRKNEDFERYASGILDQVYLLCWPGCAVDYASDCFRDKTLTIQGRHYPIEEKHRRTVHRDLLVELVQDVIHMKPGWFHYNKVSGTVIIYAMFERDFGRLASVNWVILDRLRMFFEEPENWKRVTWPPPSIKGEGVTVNCAVSWNILYEKQIAYNLLFNEGLIIYPNFPEKTHVPFCP